MISLVQPVVPPGVRNIADADQARLWTKGWEGSRDAGADACWAVVRDGAVVGGSLCASSTSPAPAGPSS